MQTRDKIGWLVGTYIMMKYNDGRFEEDFCRPVWL